MIQAQAVEHRRVQVMHLDLTFYGLVSKLVGRSVNDAPLDSSTGDPNGKPEGVMVPTVGSLGEWRAAEFAGPDHHGRIE